MNNHLEYQTAKIYLRNTAQETKQRNPTDIPMQRQVINDTADQLIRELSRTRTSAKGQQLSSFLSSYACKLHPKG
jgi:hypothetical protein